MDDKYTHQLQITTGIQSKELPEVARKVAEILSCSQRIEGTANILIANPDFSAIKTAVKIGGGEDFEIVL